MRGFGYSAAACAAVMVTVVCAGAQTMLDLQSQARNVDFSAAASTRPFPVGTLLPPVCNPGATFFRSDARAGQNLYLCTATNIWTAVEGAQQIQTGSTNSLVITAAEDDSVVMDVNPTVVTTQDGNNTFTGSNDFSRAATLQVVVSNTKPAAAACNANKVGSVALRKGDSMSGNVLYICQTTPPGGFAWKAASYGYGSGKPSSCDAGEMFFDLNGAAGQQWFGCVATNTWASVGGAVLRCRPRPQTAETFWVPTGRPPAGGRLLDSPTTESDWFRTEPCSRN